MASVVFPIPPIPQTKSIPIFELFDPSSWTQELIGLALRCIPIEQEAIYKAGRLSLVLITLITFLMKVDSCLKNKEHSLRFSRFYNLENKTGYLLLTRKNLSSDGGDWTKFTYVTHQLVVINCIVGARMYRSYKNWGWRL